MKNKKILGLMLAGVMLANIVPQVSFADKGVDVERIKGNNRYETSIAISKNAFAKSDKVVVVSGEKFADALTAGNFANQAPVLLTEKSKASSELQKEIDRLGAKEVIIIGGKGSVSKSVEKTLKTKGKKITRISGDDRYETSTKVAEALQSKNIVLANGQNFADALSAAPFAIAKNKTLVLTNGKKLPKGIDAKKVSTIIGGKNSVNIKGLENVDRISGKNRNDTSIEVMKQIGKTEKAVIADGRDYPDALSAAPLAVKMNTGILLSDDSAIDSIKSYIDKAGIKNVTIVGGENSVSKTQYQKLTGEYKPETKPAKPAKTEKKPEKQEKKPEKQEKKPTEQAKRVKDTNLSNFDINTPLSLREEELAKLVNEYRQSKGLKPLKVSKSLTFVARTHNNDQNKYYSESWKDNRGIEANLHSWSNKGKWSPVMYTEDHKHQEGMWNKPKELTNFKVDGYEISAWSDFTREDGASRALNIWKRSSGHNAVITGLKHWNTISVMGVSINGNYADIWFADETNDPAGFHK